MAAASSSAVARTSASTLNRAKTFPSSEESENAKKMAIEREETKKKVIQKLQELYSFRDKIVKSLMERANGDPTIEESPRTLKDQREAVNGTLQTLIGHLEDAVLANRNLAQIAKDQNDFIILLEKQKEETEEKLQKLQASYVILEHKFTEKASAEDLRVCKADVALLETKVNNKAQLFGNQIETIGKNKASVDDVRACQIRLRTLEVEFKKKFELFGKARIEIAANKRCTIMIVSVGSKKLEGSNIRKNVGLCKSQIGILAGKVERQIAKNESFKKEFALVGKTKVDGNCSARKVQKWIFASVPIMGIAAVIVYMKSRN